MRIACEYCGVEKYKQPATLKKNKHNFCSRECFHRYQKEFWEYPSKEKKHSFFDRLRKRFGGASSENTKNQKVPSKNTQRQIIDSKTTNPTIENP